MRIKILLVFLTLVTIGSCRIFKDNPVLLPPSDGGLGELPEEPIYEIGNAEFEYWRHSPLHVGDFQPVLFFSKATDNEGVVKMELYVYEYQLFNDFQGLPSKRKAENGLWGLQKTWNFDGKTKEVDVGYEYVPGFAPNSNVEYLFKIYNSKNELTERFAMFDAGTSPWEKDKILLYATSRNPLTKSINICFFPDIDFKKDWRKFLDQTEDLIFEGYHSNNMITNHKDVWNFYYTRQEADGYEMLVNPANESSYPDFMRGNMITGIDAFGLLHTDEYPDRTYFRSSFNFLATNTFTSEIYNYGTAVHETAHAVFRLSDEYDGCACFQSELGANVFSTAEACEAFNELYQFPDPECNVLKGYNNVPWYMPEKNILFRTEKECQDFNVANGLPRDSCQRFIDANGNWFRAYKGVCIMQDDGDRKPNPFQRVCSIVIDEYYSVLKGTTASEDTLTIPPTILVNNFFGYEPVVLMEVSQDARESYNLEVVDIQYGIPSKRILQGRGIDLSFTGKSGETICKMSLDNPSHVLFHGKQGGSEMKALEHGACILAIPFDENLAKAEMNFRSPGHQNLSIKGFSRFRGKKSRQFEIASSIKQKYLKFSKD